MTKKIPDLMPFQFSAFNGDTHIEAEVLRLRDQYGLTKAIELGTCLGSTAIWLAKHFKLVHTVEINEEYHNIAEGRIRESSREIKRDSVVCNWHGDTVEVLPKIFSLDIAEFGINEPCFIFVDSHWGNNVPLLQELEIIARSGIEPIIAIHDFMVPGKTFGYDTYNGQPFTLQWIGSCVEKIYTNGYSYHYNEQATGAQRGIVYIYPKKKT